MSALTPLKSTLRSGVSRTLRVQRKLTEWHLAAARVSERQVHAWFELHRVGLQAALRFSEAAAGSLGEERAH